MIYSLQKDLHRKFSVFEKNKLFPRAYAIPFSDAAKLKQTDPRNERTDSDMVTLLSGDWDFKFYPSANTLPDKLDTLKVKFDRVKVPSDWQRTGYQEPVYLNCPYEMKTVAPELPEDMPAGVYRRFIEIDDLSKVRILSFLGVANNLSLYINGKFVGYSEGTHNTAEFDLSPYLREGANEIVVVTFKWCVGSFLEAQDMFRENGIFRDVLLYHYDPVYLYDYEIKTEKTANGYTLTVGAEIRGALQGHTFSAVLCDNENNEIAAVSAEAQATTELRFGTLNVTEWNPEIPTVYRLYLTLAGAPSGTLRASRISRSTAAYSASTTRP